MRLWHIDLIKYLDKNHIKGQWVELNSIYKLKNKHKLINFVYETPNTIDDLYSYSLLIIEQMDRFGFRHNMKNFNDFFFMGENPKLYPCKKTNIYPKKMNRVYLRECIYNLEEKAICGCMTKEEWKLIYDRFKYDFELWDGNDLL